MRDFFVPQLVVPVPQVRTYTDELKNMKVN